MWHPLTLAVWIIISVLVIVIISQRIKYKHAQKQWANTYTELYEAYEKHIETYEDVLSDLPVWIKVEAQRAGKPQIETAITQRMQERLRGLNRGPIAKRKR